MEITKEQIARVNQVINTPILVKAVQELKAEIELLKSQNN